MSKQTRIINKRFVEGYKLSHPCKCGEKRPVLLTFHHRDPKAKTANVSTFVKDRCLESVKREVAKCDVLCLNCHRLAHCVEVPKKVKKMISFCGLHLYLPGTLPKLKAVNA